MLAAKKKDEVWTVIYPCHSWKFRSGIFTCIFKDHKHNCEQRGL